SRNRHRIYRKIPNKIKPRSSSASSFSSARQLSIRACAPAPMRAFSRRCEPFHGLAVAQGLRQTFVRIEIMAKPSVKATFSPSAGVLSVSGDDTDNVIVTSRDAAGQILVDGGAPPVAVRLPTPGHPTIACAFI